MARHSQCIAILDLISRDIAQSAEENSQENTKKVTDSVTLGSAHELWLSPRTVEKEHTEDSLFKYFVMKLKLFLSHTFSVPQTLSMDSLMVCHQFYLLIHTINN